MCLFYKTVSKKINSISLKATSNDCLNDVITTTVIAIGLVIGRLFSINLDGYLGIGVCVYILISGIFLIKETINQLIGGTPDTQLIEKVLNEINKEEKILGVHDVLYHGYGLGQVYISLHAEIDSSFSLVSAHDLVDSLERKIKKIYGVELVVHIDPVLLNDELMDRIKNILANILNNISRELHYHELKIINRKKRTNICFDLQVPYDFKLNNKEIYDMINKELRKENDNYRASITFEKY
jgi:divalent metal cation (Fe/Co/Zn/Cd) transporter